MPSTPTAIKYAPRLPGFTYAVAGGLTIWARPTFDTVGLNPPRRDLPQSRPSAICRRRSHRRRRCKDALTNMIAGSLSSCIAGFHLSCRASPSGRDPRALAQGRLSLLLASKIARTGRATANGRRAARIDPPDEHGDPALGRAIHGELLKLGFEIAQSSVARYMAKRRGPPSLGSRIILPYHAPDTAATDLFVVPTVGFDLLYAFVIVRLGRRDLVWINVTANPTAERVARQLTEAFPWDEAPRYLIRDRDRICGNVVTRRLRTMGIRDKSIAPSSPWQHGVAKRLIGSIRREYAPVSRPVQRTGVISSRAILGGLHHHHARV